MVDRCVCCGEIIPEGTQYCWACNYVSKSNEITYEDITFEDAVSYRRPMPVAFDNGYDFGGEPVFCCPRCGDDQEGNLYENDYCWSCGQALDWSEESKEKALKEHKEEN